MNLDILRKFRVFPQFRRDMKLMGYGIWALKRINHVVDNEEQCGKN